MTAELTDSVEDINRIAFGYMGSKALFAGLHLDIFTLLANGPKTTPAISQETDVPENRIAVLMTALTSVGLVDLDGEKYSNSPGAAAFLARGAKHEFCDYLRYQIDRLMYPILGQLNQTLDDTLGPDDVDAYAQWFSDPKQARLYSEAQHSGSLGPGLTLARLVDLTGARKLLDVGGGTGAMSIRLLEAFPDLNSTIIDFPNVAEIGQSFIEAAGLSNRISYIPANALEADWPVEQDAILKSYFFAGVPGESMANLMNRGFDALSPGGHYMVHDFMVQDDGKGPMLAALWQLQHLAFTPQACALSPGLITSQMEQAGFQDIQEHEMIPGMTRLLYARKRG